uniref:C2H2-type domain-containing protein n=1 Tax=Rhodosorus marinus TaxID=101924 RepID=A0A7S2ZE81_9RHOD|mmetsp:Transcript_16420/g.67725  ORF Transcript_16420/g.67725 Transcript_16420/m.67725 type:complete len:233 (+) Transcript_16420:389-1087(+)
MREASRLDSMLRNESLGSNFRPRRKPRKIFPCNVEFCPKRFTRTWNRDHHMAVVHFGIKKYACKTCNMRFDWKAQLSVHTRREHMPADGERLGLVSSAPEPRASRCTLPSLAQPTADAGTEFEESDKDDLFFAPDTRQMTSTMEGGEFSILRTEFLRYLDGFDELNQTGQQVDNIDAWDTKDCELMSLEGPPLCKHGPSFELSGTPFDWGSDGHEISGSMLCEEWTEFPQAS